MTGPSTGSSASGPAAGAADEQEQRRALAVARRNATALLVVVAVAFVLASTLPDSTATGYLVAALEAGLVGGLADWFAVVALFRHPLGLPIPHTAVIPRSKDGLGRNLATFVEGNFLSEDQVRERVADPANVDRLAGWLADPERADRVVARAAEVVGALLEVVDADEVAATVATAVRQRLGDVPVARLTGEALEQAILDGRHEGLVTAVVDGVVDGIVRNRGQLRDRLAEQSPVWVPPVLDDLVFERGEHVVRTFLVELARDPEHELRRALDQQLLDLTERLRREEAVQDRVDELVQEVLTDELLARWIERWWVDVRATVARAATEGPDGRALRRRGADALVDLGTRLHDDPVLRARAVELLGRAAGPAASIGRREVGGLIEATVERWDAEDTSQRLELWLGRDLQFVRINGTVVGAVVGVVLHAVQTLL